MLRRALLAVVLSLAGLLVLPATAQAGGIVCGVVDPYSQECKVWVPGDGSGGGGGAGSGSDDSSGVSQCYGSLGKEISCTLAGGGFWVSSYQCYVDPVPLSTDPTDGNVVWAGRTEGAIYSCGADVSMAGIGIGSWAVWLPGPPAPGPNPYDLAMDAVSAMSLRLGSVQTTPPRGTDPSLVGLPIWFWIENPGPSTTGPITTSASSGGVTVTATATLDRVEYELKTTRRILTTTCSGTAAAGTPYFSGAGAQNSPTCGFTAEQNDITGTGTLTASAFWTVQWNGGGQGGVITLPAMTRSYPFEITELQVIRTNGG